MSMVSMFAAETALKAIILTSPAIAAAHKGDPAPNSFAVILSPLPAEAELESESVPSPPCQLPEPNLEAGAALGGPKRRPYPQLESDSEAGDTVNSRLVGSKLPSKASSRPSLEQKGPLANSGLPVGVHLLPLPELNANDHFTSLEPRALEVDATLEKDDDVTATGSSASTATEKGPYFFSVRNGTTVWLDGRTPPPSVSIVHQASTIVVVPIATAPPQSTVSPKHSLVTATKPLNASTTSSYTQNSTTYITEFMTQYLTITLIGASNPGASPSSAPRWINTTRRAGGSPVSLTQATGASSGFAYPTEINSSLSSSPTNQMHLNVARQVGVVVVATINGATVSWTNDYDGHDITQSFSLNPSATTLVTVAKTTPTTPLSAPDMTVVPGSSSFISVVPVTPPIGPSSVASTVPPLTASTTLSSAETPSNPLDSTTCTETTSSKATVSTLTTSTTSSAVTASSSAACTVAVRNPNNKGDFTVNFDDLPKFGALPNDTQYPPIFSPYHHLTWVTGFAYVPPPTDPYAPISKPQLAAFLENPADNVHSNNGTDAGSFGVGDDLAQSALYFNAYSVYIGCTNKGPSQCEIAFHGYIYEPYFQNQALDALQVVYQPPCPTLTNCGMLFIPLNDEFKNLTTMQITATVDGSPVDWYMDNLELGWADNSCDALEYRQNAN